MKKPTLPHLHHRQPEPKARVASPEWDSRSGLTAAVMLVAAPCAGLFSQGYPMMPTAVFTAAPR